MGGHRRCGRCARRVRRGGDRPPAAERCETPEAPDRASDASALEPVRDTLDLALSQLDAMGDLDIDLDSAIEKIRQARAALDPGRQSDVGYDASPDPGIEPGAGLDT